MEARATLVTGGTGALGSAVVERLLGRGDRVAVTWRSAGELERLRASTGATDRLVAIEADVTDPASVDDLMAAVGERAGRLDALCNLVGGFAGGRLEDTDPATWDRMIGLNARSVFLVTRAALPLLRAAGGGRIVNVASWPAVERGARNMAAYAASKAAVVSLTHSLARELGRDGIAVNAVAPSTIDTEDNRRAMPAADRSTWLAPAEIAAVIDFLTGPGAGVVRGSVLTLGKG